MRGDSYPPGSIPGSLNAHLSSSRTRDDSPVLGTGACWIVANLLDLPITSDRVRPARGNVCLATHTLDALLNQFCMSKPLVEECSVPATLERCNSSGMTDHKPSCSALNRSECHD